jgi:hypothetical protein
VHFYYGGTQLQRYGNMLDIELPGTATGTTEVQLGVRTGQLSASGDVVWRNLSEDVCTSTFTAPTTDYLTVVVTATQAGVVNTGKLYIKAKPHGGLKPRKG